MKTRSIMAVCLAGLLSACNTTDPNLTQDHHLEPCDVLQDPPAPSQAAIDNANCPNSTDVYLSAVFVNGNPVGVGGGTVAGTGNNNDKAVQGGNNICWVATDDTGGPSGDNFDILFSPGQNPNPNQNYESVNIHPQFPAGLEFKYTVWAGEGSCEYLDPRFVIN